MFEERIMCLVKYFFCSLVITDGSLIAKQVIELNLARNGINFSSNNRDESHSCNVDVLEWGNSEQIEDIHQKCKRFDIVCGCELVYCPEVIEDLYKTVHHLCDENGVFLLGFVPRSTRIRQLLVGKFEENGWFAHSLLLAENECEVIAFSRILQGTINSILNLLSRVDTTQISQQFIECTLESIV